ncbi:MAG: cytidine deaminase [Synergistota bacterium]|nr:cytidine deaminase [Synergistota bacterium]
MSRWDVSVENMQHLLESAKEARSRAYAPYSSFRVGAAIICSDGAVYPGSNIENGSYGLSVCAERNAVAAMIQGGCRLPLAIAVAGEDVEPCYPCGACRQVLAEFNPDITVVLEKQGRPVFFSLGELLPLGFSLPKP